MFKNQSREIAKRLPAYVGDHCPDELISYRMLATVLNAIQPEVELEFFGKISNRIDYTQECNNRFFKVQSILQNYRVEIKEGIEAYPNQSKMEFMRSFFFDGITARHKRIDKGLPEIKNRRPTMRDDYAALRKDNEAQMDLLLEQAQQIAELQKAVAMIAEGLRNTPVQNLIPEEKAKTKSKTRYHIHGLLARQQQEIKKRYPHLNLTFSADKIHLPQCDNCAFVFAMTDFISHTDDENIRQRVGARYIKVAGGLSSLGAALKLRCEDTDA